MARWQGALIALVWCAACGGKGDGPGSTSNGLIGPSHADGDDDGISLVDGDCDDDDPEAHPGAIEVVGDGVDQDCDGSDRPAEPLADRLRAVHVGADPGLTLGYAVACGADIDGDGVGDLVAGAPDDGEGVDVMRTAAGLGNGRVVVLSGAQTGRVEVAPDEHVVCGDDDEHHVGLGVALQPDVDGDGSPELYVIADPRESDNTLYRFADPSSVGLTLGHAVGASPVEGIAPEVVAAVDDLDGDGVPDLAVGTPALGRVRVLFDALTGWPADQSADVEATGFGEDRFGAAIASGDLDGDGQADMAVGAPGAYGGLVWWFSGPFVRGTSVDPDALDIGAGDLLFGSYDDGDFGSAIAIGDLNGDGQDDVAVGEPLSDRGAGQVRVWFGPLTADTDEPDLVIEGEGDGDLLGSALAVADLDGDGFSELVIGAPGQAVLAPIPGRIYVFRGPLVSGETTAFEANTLLVGELGDRLGRAMAACDLDGDGASEVVIGAPEDDELADRAGKVYVIDGSAL